MPNCKNFLKQSQESLLPSVLQFWPLEIFSHLSDMILKAAAPASPICGSPLDFLYSVYVALIEGHPNWCSYSYLGLTSTLFAATLISYGGKCQVSAKKNLVS